MNAGVPVSQQQNGVQLLTRDWEGLETHNKEMEIEVELAHVEKYGKNEGGRVFCVCVFVFVLDWRGDLTKLEN